MPQHKYLNELVLGRKSRVGLFALKPQQLVKKSKGEIFTLNPKDIKYHTLVLGQSGSGKSFFLGRLIEETLLKRDSYKFVIFDLNADFIKIKESEEKTWDKDDEEKIYEGLIETYELDSEFDKFQSAWQPIIDEINVFDINEENDFNIKISWQKLKSCDLYQLLAIDSSKQPELALLVDLLINQSTRRNWSFNHWKALPKLIVKWAREKYVLDDEELEVKFDIDIARYISYNYSIPACQHLAIALKNALDWKIWNESEDNSNFENNIVSFPRLLCINLESISEKDTRLFIIRFVLERLWKCYEERKRQANSNPDDFKIKPIFIVIDEAHRVAPQIPETFSEKVVLNLIRRIAAEGRKYGISLLVATQRPQKLHSDILSECDNVALMRLVNKTDCELIAKSCGSIKGRDKKKVRKLLKYQTMISGRWTEQKTIMLERKAPQRTRPCGKGIIDDS